MPSLAATPCAESLPLLDIDLAATWSTDPGRAVRTVLETELARADQYRDCAARHRALIDWARQIADAP